nr:hypothetical protein Iba_chr02dCG1710 [Ipomoea batatas]
MELEEHLQVSKKTRFLSENLCFSFWVMLGLVSSALLTLMLLLRTSSETVGSDFGHCDEADAEEAPEGGIAGGVVIIGVWNLRESKLGGRAGLGVLELIPDFTVRADSGAVGADGMAEGQNLSPEKHFIRSAHLRFLQRPTPRAEIKLLFPAAASRRFFLGLILLFVWKITQR